MFCTLRLFSGPALAVVLIGCSTTNAPTRTDPGFAPVNPIAPPGAAPGTCWAKQVDPAVIETIIEQVLVQPAQTAADGTVTQAAVYETKTIQNIVKERGETWFETLCSGAFTPEFVSSLQRSLQVRGMYSGPVTGTMDGRTRSAVRRYQAGEGFDSSILTIEAARKLGLSVVNLPKDG